LVAAAVGCSVGLAGARAEAPAAKPTAPPDRTSDAVAKPAVPSAPRSVNEDARACFQKAQTAYATGDLASALAGFLCAFQAAPSPELHYNLARVYERMGDAEESTRHYRAYMAQSEVTPRERKRIEARLQALQDLSERQRQPLEPTKPSAAAMSTEARSFYDRGVKLFRVKQYSAAQAAFSAALQMSNAPELHFNLAVVAERLNRAQEAVDHYRAYLAGRGDAKDRDRIEERIVMLQTMGP
jgi:tetratricopeptide (TPR) repeat protein